MAQNWHRQLSKRGFGKSKCPLHPNKNVALFCKLCSNLVCLNCMTSNNHRGHSFQNLEDIVKEKENEIVQFIHNMKLVRPKISKNINDLELKKSDFQEKKVHLLKDICTEYEKRLDQLKKRKQDMEAEVNTLFDRYCKHYDLLKDNMEVLNKKLEDYSKQFQEIFDEGSLVEKFDAWQSIPLKEKEANSDLDEPHLNTFDFVLDQNKIEEFMKIAVGEIKVYQNTKEATTQPDIKVNRPSNHAQIISTSILSNNISPRYFTVTPIAEDKAWCRTSEGRKIYLITKKREVQNKLPLHSANIRSLCLHPITGVMYGAFADKTICIINTTTGATTSMLSCINVPGCLTIAPNGDIIVGEFSLSLGHVYRYSSKGQLLHQSKERYNVWDISYSDINDHVVIACDIDGIIVMDGTLTNVIQTHKLKCFTVVYDKIGNLIIGDWYEKSVHILDGQTFSTIRTFKPPQISSPLCIRVYDNSMWVECENPNEIIHFMFK